MHYYVEKTIEHRLDDAMRAHRNATFVRELWRLRQGDRTRKIRALSFVG